MTMLYITIYLAIGLCIFNRLINYKPPAYKFKDEKKQREYDKKAQELITSLNDAKALMASNVAVAIGTMLFTSILWPIIIFGTFFKK